MNINGKTRVCAVIGDPVEHTLSPTMHNAAFTHLGLNYAYVPFHVRDVQQAMQGLVGFNIRGLSVTIPHKLTVMEFMDEISPLAQKIGAVNTITNNNGKLTGTNTDGYGTLKAIESIESINNKTVAIIGVGGAARAAAFTIACERKPAHLYLLGRNFDKTKNLAEEVAQNSESPITASSLDYDEMKKIFDYTEIIVQTTPVGMSPNVDDTIIPEDLINENHVVFDMIYNPAETLLLRQAKARSARTVNGVPMFVHQGAEQFRLWTGEEAPIETMEQAVKKALGHP